MLVGVASKHSNTRPSLKYQISYNSWPYGAIMGDIQENLATMNQTMPNSQEEFWKSNSGFRIDKAAKATLCSKAEAIYPLSAPGSEGESCYCSSDRLLVTYEPR